MSSSSRYPVCAFNKSCSPDEVVVGHSASVEHALGCSISMPGKLDWAIERTVVKRCKMALENNYVHVRVGKGWIAQNRSRGWNFAFAFFTFLELDRLSSNKSSLLHGEETDELTKLSKSTWWRQVTWCDSTVNEQRQTWEVDRFNTVTMAFQQQ